nr:MAG TPA: hypothetical protein [Caudoviricetes sp.]DAL15918.1 MAG TPA_asm: hypothetical protein [Caudoviricetes sp.]
MQLLQHDLLGSDCPVVFAIDKKPQEKHRRSQLPCWGFRRTFLTLLLSYTLLNLFRY